MLSANEISGSSAKSNRELNETLLDVGVARNQNEPTRLSPLIAASVTKRYRSSSRCYSQERSIVTRRAAMVDCPTYGFERHHPSVAIIASTVITIYWHQPQVHSSTCTHTHNARPAPLLTRDAGNVRSLVTKQEMSRLTGHAPPMHVLHKAQVMPVKKHVCDWVFQFVH
jgi:hypothetical protein